MSNDFLLFQNAVAAPLKIPDSVDGDSSSLSHHGSMDTGLVIISSPFAILALGSLLLSVRLSPILMLTALVSGAGTVGSVFGVLYLAHSWSVLWLAVPIWIIAFVAGSALLAIAADRAGASIAPVVLGGASTGLVLLGVYIFSHGWIAIIVGFGTILIGLLPAGLAYSLIDTGGIAGIVRNAGVVAIAGIFGLFGFEMLNSDEIVPKMIGLLLCLGTVGILMLAFPALRPSPERDG